MLKLAFLKERSIRSVEDKEKKVKHQNKKSNINIINADTLSLHDDEHDYKVKQLKRN
jgi:hypothetical protein